MNKIVYQVCIAFSVFLFIEGCIGSNSNDAKLQQYLVQGEQLYKQHCANCHQVSGEGLRKLYPPIKNSDFLVNSQAQVMCIIKYGSNKPIVVNGVEYNMAMPANIQLTDLEVAEITTYIYNTWSTTKGITDVRDAERELSACEK